MVTGVFWREAQTFLIHLHVYMFEGKLIFGHMSCTLRVTSSRSPSSTCRQMYLHVKNHAPRGFRTRCYVRHMRAHVCTRWQAALFITTFQVLSSMATSLPGMGLWGQERTWAWQSL